MSSSKKIVLWSRKEYQACQELKAFLAEKGYSYENVDVEGRDYLRDILELKYGVRHVPVVEIGSHGIYEGITDSDFARIERLLSGSERSGGES